MTTDNPFTNSSKNNPSADQSSTHQSSTNIAIIGAGLTGLITADLLEQAFKHHHKPITISIFEKSAGVGRLATRYKKPNFNQVIQASEAVRVLDTSSSLNASDNLSASNPSNPLDALNGAESIQPIAAGKQWQFDFGAQFFTAKTQAFQAYLQPWLTDGTIEPWQAVLAKVNTNSSSRTETNAVPIKLTGHWGLNQPRYISSPKMTTWGRALAQKLTNTTLHYKTRVAPLNQATYKNAETTLVDVNNNPLGIFDWVICTAPQGQAIEMVANTDFALADDEALKQTLTTDSLYNLPNMLACYTLMLGWTHRQRMPEMLQQAQWSVLEVATKDSAQHAALKCLGRLFIEHKKPNRDNILPSVTLHANNDWAQAHVDDDIEHIKAQLLQAAQHILQWDKTTAPAHIDCHRWRYAATQKPTSQNQKPTSQNQKPLDAESGSQLLFVDANKQWVVTGDWCAEGRIESCFQAAAAVVRQITGTA